MESAGAAAYTVTFLQHGPPNYQGPGDWPAGGNIGSLVAEGLCVEGPAGSPSPTGISCTNGVVLTQNFTNGSHGVAVLAGDDLHLNFTSSNSTISVAGGNDTNLSLTVVGSHDQVYLATLAGASERIELIGNYDELDTASGNGTFLSVHLVGSHDPIDQASGAAATVSENAWGENDSFTSATTVGADLHVYYTGFDPQDPTFSPCPYDNLSSSDTVVEASTGLESASVSYNNTNYSGTGSVGGWNVTWNQVTGLACPFFSPFQQAWSVKLNGNLEGVSAGPIAFTEPNGTYDYFVEPIAGYTASPGAGSVTVNGTSVSVPITFTELPPVAYNVSFTTEPSSCGSVTFHGGSYTEGEYVEIAPGSYRVAALACSGYSLQSLKGSQGVSVSRGRATVTGSGGIVATFVADKYPIQILSQFKGDFYSDIPFENTFGVSTLSKGVVASSVNGTIQGDALAFSDAGGGLFETTVNMGELSPGAVLNVTASFPGGWTSTATYPVTVVKEPRWLQSFVQLGRLTTTTPSQLLWNGEFSVTENVSIDLSSDFEADVPTPEFAGGGSYDLEPAFNLSITLDSAGNVTLSGSFSLSIPTIDAGAASVDAQATISASGSFRVADGTVQWESAKVVLSIGGSVSFNVPIAGYTFDVPFYGPVTIGLSATISVDPSVALTLELLPAQSAGRDLIPGLGVELHSIFGSIGADLSIAVNAGIGVASVTGGGSVGLTMYVKAQSPYLEGGKITGTVFVKWQALWWSGTIWSESGTLYQWGTVPGGAGAPVRAAAVEPAANLTNLTEIPRYYNTTDYNEVVWQDGQSNAVAVEDVYPYTSLSAAGSGANGLLLYGTDNVQNPEDEGPSTDALQFDATTNSLSRVSPPPVGGEVTFQPKVVALPNGSFAAIWDAVPFRAAVVASPFDIKNTVLQLAFYDPSTSRWSAVRNLTGSGFSESYALDTSGEGTYALDLTGAGLMSSAQQLVELSTASQVLASLAVTNVAQVVSFRASAGLAVVRYDNGTYALLDLATGASVDPIGQASPTGVKQMSFLEGSADLVASLLASGPSDSLVLFNTSSQQTSSVAVPSSITSLTAIAYEGREVVAAASTEGLSVDIVAGTTVTALESFPYANLTAVACALSGSHLVVFSTENFGSESFPLLNLSVSAVSLGSHDVTFSETGAPTGSRWGVSVGTLGANGSTTGRSLSVLQPSGPLRFELLPPAGYGVYEVTGPGDENQTAATISENTTLQIVFRPLESLRLSETGLPTGSTWGVTLRSTVKQGGPPSQHLLTSGTTLGFTVTKGSWRFEVTSGNRTFSAKPARGTVGVPAHSQTKVIRFQRVIERVVFHEKGLRRGTLWGVNLTGPTDESLTTHGGSLTFGLPNGTYGFTVWNLTSAHPSPAAGSLSVRVLPHVSLKIEVVYSTGAGGMGPALSAPVPGPTPLGWLVAAIRPLPETLGSG